MRAYSVATQAALEANRLRVRRAVWFTVRDRSDDSLFSEGYWSDVYSRSLSVINPNTGGVTTRTYYGGGRLIEIDPLPQSATLQVRRPRMRLSHVHDRVIDLLIAYDARQAPIEIHRVLIDPDSQAQVDDAVPQFVGRLNILSVTEPAAGEPGSIDAEMVDRLEEINRTFSATRSSADQKTRLSSDTFCDDAEVAAELDLPWGQESTT